MAIERIHLTLPVISHPEYIEHVQAQADRLLKISPRNALPPPTELREPEIIAVTNAAHRSAWERGYEVPIQNIRVLDCNDYFEAVIVDERSRHRRFFELLHLNKDQNVLISNMIPLGLVNNASESDGIIAVAWNQAMLKTHAYRYFVGAARDRQRRDQEVLYAPESDVPKNTCLFSEIVVDKETERRFDGDRDGSMNVMRSWLIKSIKHHDYTNMRRLYVSVESAYPSKRHALEAFDWIALDRQSTTIVGYDDPRLITSGCDLSIQFVKKDRINGLLDDSHPTYKHRRNIIYKAFGV